MTVAELNEKIVNSPNYEWYKNFSLEFNYPQIGFNVKITGVSSIYSFFSTQAEGYGKYEELPSALNSLKTRFEDAKELVERFVEDDNASEYSWSTSFESITSNRPPVFLYDSPATEFLINLNIANKNQYQAAYQYITGSISSIGNKDYLIGYLQAYEFSEKDSSKIVERKNLERKSIAKIRSDFQANLSEAQTQLLDYLAKAKEKSDENSNENEQFRIERNHEFRQWYDLSVANVKYLEDLYQAKLKLEAPATYWRIRAKKLRREGYGWLAAFVACIVGGVVILTWILNKISNGTFQVLFKETATAVKWSIAMITLISFIAYLIRVFSKLTFSSFHLVRDAEEREQLTYVYLALQREKGIDQTERHLIMQSLFSRADSGLLKDDASPTMPGGIIDQLSKK